MTSKAPDPPRRYYRHRLTADVVYVVKVTADAVVYRMATGTSVCSRPTFLRSFDSLPEEQPVCDETSKTTPA